jgi:hypothetical protein
MATQRFARHAGWAGIVAVIIFAAAGALSAVVGGSGDSRAEIVAAYSNGDDNVMLGVSTFLMGLAVVAFIPFLVGLRSRLAGAGGQTRDLANVALAGGLLMVGFLGLSSLLAVAVPAAKEFFDAYQVNPDVAMTFEAASWWMLHFVSLAGAVLVGASTLAARRSGALPRWLAIAGYPVAVIGLAGLFTSGASIGLQVLWLLATSVCLVREGRAAARVTRPAVGTA